MVPLCVEVMIVFNSDFRRRLNALVSEFVSACFVCSDDEDGIGKQV